jgi:hypothetical protein
MPTPYSPRAAIRRPAAPSRAVEVVGNLNQNPGAVTHQRIGSTAPAMVQVLENLQTLGRRCCAICARDVGNESDSTRVAFVEGSYKPALAAVSTSSREAGADGGVPNLL